MASVGTTATSNVKNRLIERRRLPPARARIFIVVTLSETGGAQKYVTLLAEGLASEFDVVVAAHGHGPLAKNLRRIGVRFVPLQHLRRPITLWRDVLALLELLRVLRRERPHIVHAVSSKAGVVARLAAWLSRVPIRVFTAQGWAFSAHSGLASSSYRWADRVMSRLTTFTICVSESGLRQGLRAGTCHADRSLVIRNAIDMPLGRSDRPQHETPVLVSVGRFQRPKDFVTLVHALSMLDKSSYRAQLVGDGPLRAEIEEEIRALALNDTVSLTGELADIEAVLASADLFVLSTDSEGLPLSILEAMAAGLPVVASAVGGVPEVVDHGVTGLLVPPRDASSFAQAIQNLIENPVRRREMGIAGRARVRTSFDLPTFLNCHLKVYRSLLAERGFRFISP